MDVPVLSRELHNSREIIAVSILLYCISACNTGTTENLDMQPNEGYPFLTKLEEIKRTKQGQDIDPGLSSVIEGTPHFSASRYLAKHPEARGPAAARSNSAVRVGILPRIRITAPKEPIGGGPGTKKGNVAGMP